MKCYKCWYMKLRDNDFGSREAYCLLASEWCKDVIDYCDVERPIPQVNNTTLGDKNVKD